MLALQTRGGGTQVTGGRIAAIGDHTTVIWPPLPAVVPPSPTLMRQIRKWQARGAIEMDDFANETANRKDEKSEQNQRLGLRGLGSDNSLKNR
jgi:hypothetical protein